MPSNPDIFMGQVLGGLLGSEVSSRVTRVRELIDSSIRLLAPFLLAITAGVLTAVFFQNPAAILLVPIAAFFVGFSSKRFVLAFAATLLMEIIHSTLLLVYAPQIAYFGNQLIFTLFSLLPLLVVSSLAYFGTKTKVQGLKGKAIFLAGVLAAGALASLPLLPPGYAKVDFGLIIGANQKITLGLTLIIPLPLLNGVADTRITEFPRTTDVSSDWTADYASSIVDTDFGPGLRLDVRRLPRVIGPIFNDSDFPDGSSIYQGWIQFGMDAPYPRTIESVNIELSQKTNISGPSSAEEVKLGFTEKFRAPVWFSVPQGLKVTVYIGTGYFALRSIDFYGGIARNDESGDEMNIRTPQRTGWIWGDGTTYYRSYLRPSIGI